MPTARLLALPLLGLLLLGAGLPAAAAAAPGTASARITVAAGASLTDVLPAIDRGPTYSFGGSNAQATQIRNGAPVDVFASANIEIPTLLYEQGYVSKPVAFTRNTLVIVVPKSNPAGITNVYDLAKPGVKVAVGAPSVPVGSYTLQILKQMNLTAKVTENVVTEETDVRSVLTKVVLGQADAGFVYATDARTVPDDVKVIKVPAWAQPKVVYGIAIVSQSSNKADAQAFVDRVLSKEGQAGFARYGFLALPAALPAAGLDATKVALARVASPVRRGAIASVTVAVTPKRACTIAVSSSKGNRVAAKGLVRKQPAAGGRITWAWTIPRAAVPGRWPVRVTCAGAQKRLRTSFVVLR